MANILLPISSGFEEVELVSLVDVLRRGGAEVRIAYVDSEFESDLIVGANGITIKADTALKNVISEDFDMILFAGGWDNTYVLRDNSRVQKLIKEFYNDGKVIGAMCASVVALKEAGVLGSEYTCYPAAKDEVDHEGYRDDKMVVTDGNIMTSRGPGTALCFGLEILKRMVGVESYQAVKDGMLLNFCE
ncbi:4-methyl-5(B-hydroxyethyl)-thiazole monophosphate biosynthesis enzyme [hydrothermal vent metagenome]|uniref:4-methyl-5(B-hydroxyethyl)-thiazole monophosphate biosynthesis enzyme n=1 Tax=hydrothermal vent metagenome TaxID=652676 RepID=A0A1W1CNB0_9ZZZZ